jgi:hypothetical protein
MLDITIMTCIVYLLANSFTYKIGTEQQCNAAALHDVLHALLPNWSQYIFVRDFLLILFLIPLLWSNRRWALILEFWGLFLYVVLIKAVCIFFTYIPSSFPKCGSTDYQYLNHCHHIQVSAHAAFCMLLAILYTKHGLCSNLVYLVVAAYCIFILLTRAHYTCNVLEGVILAALIAHG